MDHLLALKVMRLSRPSLAAHPQPFFSDSTVLAAHARASPLSLESSAPLPLAPSTLRDLGQSQVLLLPEAFGSISLGETFTSSLCVNNESSLEVLGGHLLVEMQTATTKVALGEIGGISSRLQPGKMFQLVVSHEIKELGQHVLACTVSYHVPPALRNSVAPPEDPSNPSLRMIRKFYKFIVSNPLSVRTKVHIPRSPTALLSRAERHKVFLEVHVQNLTPKPLYFERIQFECAEGWILNPSVSEHSKLLNDSLRPQDLRQYMYILSPTPAATPSFPIPYPPGTIIALGRLDMTWRSSFGEPGRLLTSMLSRKIPLPPAAPPAPAIPPHLQRQVPGRPSSPVPYKTRPPAPGRPQSPAMGRPMSPSLSGGSVSTGVGTGSVGIGVTGVNIGPKEVEVDLVVNEIPGTAYLDKPFKIKCSVGVMAPLPLPSQATGTPTQKTLPLESSDAPAPIDSAAPNSESTDTRPKRARLIRLALQHTHHLSLRPSAPTKIQTMAPEVASPRALLSALSSPGTPRGGMSVNPELRDLGSILQGELTTGNTPGGKAGFPPPYSPNAPAESPAFLGASTQILPPILLDKPAKFPTEGSLVALSKSKEGRGEGWVDVDLEYVCLSGKKGGGMVRIGGVKVYLVEDREVDLPFNLEADRWEGGSNIVLAEWDIVGEAWVERNMCNMEKS